MDQTYTIEDEEKKLLNNEGLPHGQMITVLQAKPEDNRTYDQIMDESFGLDVDGIHRSAKDNIYNLMHGNSKYDPDYGPLLIYHMGKGYTLTSFATIIGVDRSTVHNWFKQHSAFNFCRDIAERRMKLKWERIILESAQGIVKGNAAAIIFAIKNYFPDEYKDKREVEHTASVMLVDTGIRRVDGNTIEGEVVKMDRRRRPVLQNKTVDVEVKEIPSTEYTEDLEDQL